MTYGLYAGLGDSGGFRYDGCWTRYGFPCGGDSDYHWDSVVVGGHRGADWLHGIFSDLTNLNTVVAFGPYYEGDTFYTTNAMYVSHDRGQTWSTDPREMYRGGEGFNGTAAVRGGVIWFACGDWSDSNGLWRTDNDGVAWTQIDTDPDVNYNGVLSLALGTTKIWYQEGWWTGSARRYCMSNLDGTGKTTIWTTTGSAYGPAPPRAFGDSFCLLPNGDLTKLTAGGVATTITPSGISAGTVVDAWPLTSTTYICLVRDGDPNPAWLPGGGDGVSSIWRTTDSGATWTNVLNAYGPQYSATSGGCGELFNGSSGIAVAPDNSDIYVIGGVGEYGPMPPNYPSRNSNSCSPPVIWHSTDLGVTWVPTYHQDPPYGNDGSYQLVDIWGIVIGPVLPNPDAIPPPPTCFADPHQKWWAIGADNAVGILGAGISDPHVPAEYPKLIAGYDFKKIVSSPVHCAAIDGAGQLWTWGDNTMGQLGTGNTDPMAVPFAVTVTGSPMLCFDVAVGGSSASDAFTLAFYGDGGYNSTLYHAGSNADGTRDIGSRDSSVHTSWQASAVFSNTAGLGRPHDVSLVAIDHCAAILKQSDSIYMIGWHGNPWPDGGGYQPSVWTSSWTEIDLLSLMPDGASIAEISYAKNHALLRTRESEPGIAVMHWGQQGAIDGTGRSLSGWDSVPVAISALNGQRNSTVWATEGGGALLTSGQGTTAQGPGYMSTKRLYVWGTNAYGECGNGTTTPVPTPIVYALPVEGLAPAYIPNDNGDARAITVITADGQYWASGNNAASIVCKHSEEPVGTTGHLVTTPTRGYLSEFGTRGSKMVHQVGNVGLILHMGTLPRATLYAINEDSAGYAIASNGVITDAREWTYHEAANGVAPWWGFDFSGVGASRSGQGGYAIETHAVDFWETQDAARWTRHNLADFASYTTPHPDVWTIRSWIPGEAYVVQGRDISHYTSPPGMGVRYGIYKTVDWGVSWTKIVSYPASADYADWQFGIADIGTSKIWYILDRDSSASSFPSVSEIWTCNADGSGQTMVTRLTRKATILRALNDTFCIAIQTSTFTGDGPLLSKITSGGVVTDLYPTIHSIWPDFRAWDITCFNIDEWVTMGDNGDDSTYVMRTNDAGGHWDTVLITDTLTAAVILGASDSYRQIDAKLDSSPKPGYGDGWMNGCADYLVQQSWWYTVDTGMTWELRTNLGAIKNDENDLWVYGPGSIAVGSYNVAPAFGARSYVQIIG